jgi:hypothetical protein
MARKSSTEYHREWQRHNPEKQKEYKRRYRERHGEAIRARERQRRHTPEGRKYQREWQRKRQPQDRARVREIVRKLKDVPCADCGKRFPWYVMDFDHVRGKKLNNIGSMGNALTATAILEEAKKCDVVCACCHRIRSWIT